MTKSLEWPFIRTGRAVLAGLIGKLRLPGICLSDGRSRAPLRDRSGERVWWFIRVGVAVKSASPCAPANQRLNGPLHRHPSPDTLKRPACTSPLRTWYQSSSKLVFRQADLTERRKNSPSLFPTHASKDGEGASWQLDRFIEASGHAGGGCIGQDLRPGDGRDRGEWRPT